MSDRTLTCRDCGNEFVFTAGEQDFYTSRGFSDPQRCQSCRQQRKQQRNDGDSFGGGYSGGGDSYGNGGGGGYSRGGGGGYGGNGGGQRTLYPATCSECGKETEVPFNPSPGKPVYCRECFQSRKASSPRYNY